MIYLTQAAVIGNDLQTLSDPRGRSGLGLLIRLLPASLHRLLRKPVTQDSGELLYG